jgi:hypothetical protein
MTCATVLENAWFRVDNRHTCGHQLDASINTMKYLNVPHNGCIGPQMSPCILSRNFSGSVYILRGECLKTNFPVAHVVHMKLEVLRIWLLLNYDYAIANDFSHRPYTRIPSLSCQIWSASTF